MTIPELDALLEAEPKLIAARQEIIEMIYAGKEEASAPLIDGLVKAIFELGFSAEHEGIGGYVRRLRQGEII